MIFVLSRVLYTSRCDVRFEWWGEGPAGGLLWGGIDVECSRIENRKTIVRNHTAMSELASLH